MDEKSIAGELTTWSVDHEKWYSPELIRQVFPVEENIGNLRLNWKPNEPGMGFHFIVTTFACEDDSGECRDVEIHGTAYFDGVRHMYFGDSGAGYIYYPSVRDLTQVTARLRALELAFCSAPEGVR